MAYWQFVLVIIWARLVDSKMIAWVVFVGNGVFFVCLFLNSGGLWILKMLLVLWLFLYLISALHSQCSTWHLMSACLVDYPPLFVSWSESLMNVAACLFCFCWQIYASKCLHSNIYNMGIKSRRKRSVCSRRVVILLGSQRCRGIAHMTEMLQWIDRCP